MDELLVFAGQELLQGEFLPKRLIVPVALGTFGLMLYSASKEPTDEWDRFLRFASICMLIAGAVWLMAIVSQLIYTTA